ncbi:AMIN domain-containing protein, partial [Nitrospira defluvii]|nr:AMIN domain-containing protein [Nitrospira defluvii]
MGQMIRLVAITMVSSLVISCIAARPTVSIESSPITEIQDIRVIEKDGKMVIEIEGEEPMIYTTFQLSHPDRLVIDMAGIGLGQFSDEIHMESGPIQSIRPIQGGGENVARLEFLLADSVEAEVKTEGLNLVIEVAVSQKMKSEFTFFEDEVAGSFEETLIDAPVEEIVASLAAAEALEGSAEAGDVVMLEGSQEGLSNENIAAPMEETLEEFTGEGTAAGTEEALESPIEEALAPTEKIEEDVSEETALAAVEPMEEIQRELSEETPGKPLEEVLENLVEEVAQHPLEKGVVESVEETAGLPSPGDVEPPSLVPFVPPTEGPEHLESEPSFEKVLAETDEEVVVPQEDGTVTEAPQVLVQIEEAPLPLAKHVVSARFVRDVDLQLVVVSDGKLIPNLFFVDHKRLVIDLPGVKTVMRQTRVLANDVHVKQVRIGQHRKKLRFVVDLISPVTYSWKLDRNQLVVTLRGPSAQKTRSEHAVKDQVEDPILITDGSESGLREPIDPFPPQMIDIEGELDGEMKAEKPSVSAAPETESLPSLPPPLMAPVPVVTVPEEETVLTTPRKETEENEEKLKTDAPDKKKAFLKRLREKSANKKISRSAAESANGETPLSPQKKYVGKKISLDFQDAEIKNVIRLLAEVSRLNFVMADDVKGTVTLKLEDVPWDQALNIILEMNSLGGVREGNIIRVTTLANLAKQRAQEAQAKESKIKAEDLLTRVVYINYAKAAEMKTLLDKLLSSRGEIMVDTRTNTVIVKDIESNVDDIERLSKRLDAKTPQVLIEARIVEVAPSFLRSLGIKWGADLKATTGGNL